MAHIITGPGAYHGRPVTEITDPHLKYFVVEMEPGCLKVKGMSDEDIAAILEEYKLREERKKNVDTGERNSSST